VILRRMNIVTLFKKAGSTVRVSALTADRVLGCEPQRGAGQRERPARKILADCVVGEPRSEHADRSAWEISRYDTGILDF